MYLVKAYVDGAVKNNGGPGRIGVGFVLHYFDVDSDHKNYIRERHGYAIDVPLATNNLAELEAILAVGRYVYTQKRKTHIEVYSDSLWSVNAIRKIWKITHHLGLLSAIEAEYAEYASFQVFWTKGHSDNRWNNLANDIAQMEAGTWKKRSNPYETELY